MQAIGKATDFFPGQDFSVKYFLGFTFSHSIIVHLLLKVLIQVVSKCEGAKWFMGDGKKYCDTNYVSKF